MLSVTKVASILKSLRSNDFTPSYEMYDKQLIHTNDNKKELFKLDFLKKIIKR